MKETEIIVASYPDRENLVAEIWIENSLWVEISQETESVFATQFFAHPSGKAWQILLDDAVQLLTQAKRKLVGDKEVG